MLRGLDILWFIESEFLVFLGFVRLFKILNHFSDF